VGLTAQALLLTGWRPGFTLPQEFAKPSRPMADNQ